MSSLVRRIQRMGAHRKLSPVGYLSIDGKRQTRIERVTVSGRSTKGLTGKRLGYTNPKAADRLARLAREAKCSAARADAHK